MLILQWIWKLQLQRLRIAFDNSMLPSERGFDSPFMIKMLICTHILASSLGWSNNCVQIKMFKSDRHRTGQWKISAVGCHPKLDDEHELKVYSPRIEVLGSMEFGQYAPLNGQLKVHSAQQVFKSVISSTGCPIWYIFKRWLASVVLDAWVYALNVIWY